MPRGYPTNTDDKLIQEKIDELKERLKISRSRVKQRTALVNYCKRRGFTRGDLYAAAADLPKMHITRKDRLKTEADRKAKDAARKAVERAKKNKARSAAQRANGAGQRVAA